MTRISCLYRFWSTLCRCNHFDWKTWTFFQSVRTCTKGMSFESDCIVKRRKSVRRWRWCDWPTGLPSFPIPPPSVIAVLTKPGHTIVILTWKHTHTETENRKVTYEEMYSPHHTVWITLSHSLSLTHRLTPNTHSSPNLSASVSYFWLFGL